MKILQRFLGRKDEIFEPSPLYSHFMRNCRFLSTQIEYEGEDEDEFDENIKKEGMWGLIGLMTTNETGISFLNPISDCRRIAMQKDSILRYRHEIQIRWITHLLTWHCHALSHLLLKKYQIAPVYFISILSHRISL